MHAVARHKVAARSVQHQMQVPPAAGLTRAPVKSAPACRSLQMHAVGNVLQHTCDDARFARFRALHLRNLSFDLP